MVLTASRMHLSVELDGEDLGVELPARDFGALVEVTDAEGARVVPRHDGHKAAREQPLRDVDGTAYCKIQWTHLMLRYGPLRGEI